MWRRASATVAVALTIGATLGVAAPVQAAASGPLVGTWSGSLIPASGSHAARRQITVTVNPGERTGSWRIGASCSGKLRLQSISWGYHHFYRLAGANRGCAPTGIDCLKRAGSRLVDEFTSNSGAADADGSFRRLH